jgi:uncharacterized membrane protein YoaK (UPF0700 family)
MKFFNIYHLTQVEETYWQHLKFGLWACLILLVTSFVSFVHAFFPFLLARVPDNLFKYFIASSQNRLDRINKVLKQKGIE